MINFIIYDCVFLYVSCDENQLLEEYTWISSQYFNNHDHVSY